MISCCGVDVKDFLISSPVDEIENKHFGERAQTFEMISDETESNSILKRSREKRRVQKTLCICSLSKDPFE